MTPDFGERFTQHMAGLRPANNNFTCAKCMTVTSCGVRCLTCTTYRGRWLCGLCDALTHEGPVGVSLALYCCKSLWPLEGPQHCMHTNDTTHTHMHSRSPSLLFVSLSFSLSLTHTLSLSLSLSPTRQPAQIHIHTP
jgi:hypothetical protein